MGEKTDRFHYWPMLPMDLLGRTFEEDLANFKLRLGARGYPNTYKLKGGCQRSFLSDSEQSFGPKERKK